jgi:hypothetical protein
MQQPKSMPVRFANDQTGTLFQRKQQSFAA